MSEEKKYTMVDIFGNRRSVQNDDRSDTRIEIISNKIVEGQTIKQKLKTANSVNTNPTITLDEYCNVVYEWLRINPHVYSVLDYYEDDNNKPFHYPLSSVLKSEKIRTLLEQRMGRDSATGKLKGKSIEMMRNWYWGGDCFLKDGGGNSMGNGDVSYELN